MGYGSMLKTRGQKKLEETETTGQFWRSTIFDMDTRLRVSRGIAKTETQASVEAFKMLKERGHPDAPPPLVSDGWGGIDEALIEVYGCTPAYSGRGRPSLKKRADDDWQYLQVVKHRENGRVIGTELRVIYGDRQTVLTALGKSTSHVERTHLTMRHLNSRLRRKTIAYSKELNMCKASCVWEDMYYNWMRPHKSLRIEIFGDPKRRWKKQTPAMAAKLTDHIWNVKELLYLIKTPLSCNNT